MKEGKSDCVTPNPPKPNLKNKDFVKWSKGESCKKDDNIVSTDWHERLQRISPFVPVYNNVPLNMVYLLSGEYGRIWQKERDEWYSRVFVRQGREKDMEERKKRIRKEIKEAKKAAQIKIQERKERKAKEAELKAKAEAEKAEKLKAKLQKCAAAKQAKMKKSKKDEPQQPVTAQEPNTQGCPKGWTPVELTVQCECSNHNKETNEKEKEKATEEPKTPTARQNPNKPLDTRPQEPESAEQSKTYQQGMSCECKGH